MVRGCARRGIWDALSRASSSPKNASRPSSRYLGGCPDHFLEGELLHPGIADTIMPDVSDRRYGAALMRGARERTLL